MSEDQGQTLDGHISRGGQMARTYRHLYTAVVQRHKFYIQP